MAWWPSSRGLTGFASAVLRALFDGFDGMVASRRGRRRVINAEGGEAPDASLDTSGRQNPRKKVARLNKLTDESAMNGR